MQHLDQHTLAFYAMAAEFTASEMHTIESHLRECHGCQAQVEELRGVNHHVAETIDSAESTDDLPSHAIVTMPRAIKRRPDAPPVRLSPRSLTRSARLTALVRRHPVSTGSVGLVLAFLAFFSINSLFRWQPAKTEQPLFVKLNTLGTALEVYGKDAKIFEIAVDAVRASETERERLLSVYTQISDLDGNGTMEVLTGSPYRQDGKEFPNVLRIYNDKGDLITSRAFGGSLTYLGVNYSGSFGISGILVFSSGTSKEREILVGLSNARSPWCLTRLDHTGKTLGEYWHFGWLNWHIPFSLEGIDHEVIVLSGENDQDYRANNVYPVFTLLDPAKIEGRTESECTRGFGLPASDAQLYYVRSGNVDSTFLSGVSPENPSFGYYLKTGADSSIDVCQGFSVPSDFPQVIYTFDKYIQLKDVWMSDGPRLTLTKKWLADGSEAGYREFLADLRKKVRYWDGTRWTKEPAKIVHALP